MADLLHRTLGERVELQLSFADNLWPALCDPNQLENAVLNLAINARDAMPDGGTLTIETFNVDIAKPEASIHGDLRPGQYICVRVIDTGAGMEPDIVARAFEPFFTTKPMGQGTGLGLSMIYGFARQSDGHVNIQSEIGTGTTFDLYLPRDSHAKDEEINSAARRDLTPSGAGTVLVVEDEPVVRTLIVEVLADLGYQVLEAGDGPSGLEILQSRQPIDLLITDIGLPGLNGRQVADAARVARPGLKVLFMTGYAQSAAAAAGFLEPGMAMVIKPFGMDDFATRIRALINDH
jgi:CheY-like chemotaxis protein